MENNLDLYLDFSAKMSASIEDINSTITEFVTERPKYLSWEKAQNVSHNLGIIKSCVSKICIEILFHDEFVELMNSFDIMRIDYMYIFVGEDSSYTYQITPTRFMGREFTCYAEILRLNKEDIRNISFVVTTMKDNVKIQSVGIAFNELTSFINSVYSKSKTLEFYREHEFHNNQVAILDLQF